MELVGVVEYPKKVRAGRRYPCVVLSHSFTGHKDIPHLRRLAESLVERGFFSFRFDFSDCIGESDGTCEQMRLSKQVSDLKTAMGFVSGKDPVDPGSIGLAGHSLGGLTSIIVASTDDRPSALVPIAAPTKGTRDSMFDEEEVEEWRRSGSIEFETVRRGKVSIGYGFWEDMDRYDGLDSIRDVHVPVRFVHGTDDEVVPPAHSEEMYEAANEPKDLRLVEGGDHLFKRRRHEEEMKGATVDWLEEHV